MFDDSEQYESFPIHLDGQATIYVWSEQRQLVPERVDIGLPHVTVKQLAS